MLRSSRSLLLFRREKCAVGPSHEPDLCARASSPAWLPAWPAKVSVADGPLHMWLITYFSEALERPLLKGFKHLQVLNGAPKTDTVPVSNVGHACCLGKCD